MRNLHLLAFSALTFIGAVMQGEAAIVTVNFDSGSFLMTDSNGSTVLSGGTAAEGNGAVVQLGYFNAATGAFPFNGNWVPLTGQGGANPAFSTTSVGDQAIFGATNGQFAISVTFDTQDSTKNQSLPAAGVPLAVRVFNKTTTSASTFYQTISSNLTTWQWQTPADAPANPLILMSLDDGLATLRREDGTPAGAAVVPPFSTNVVNVPEPSALTLAAFGGVGMLLARRRKQAK